jgi:hypothetical protein
MVEVATSAVALETKVLTEGARTVSGERLFQSFVGHWMRAMASPCSGGEGVEVGALDVELLVVYLVESGEAGKSAPLLEGRPLQLVQDGGDACRGLVVVGDEAGCSSLDSFNVVGVLMGGGVPER